MEKHFSKVSPVDTTDDILMVRLGLRQPEVLTHDFSKTNDEKLAIKLAKKQFKQSKSNKL